ncbi:hypothetical protein GCM10009558_009140 [Virgisporangium aurantiacum]
MTVPMLALSSIARTRTVIVPAPDAMNVYDHDDVPLVAGCQVAPSVDTSMPATRPPVSVAVPVRVTCEP